MAAPLPTKATVAVVKKPSLASRFGGSLMVTTSLGKGTFTGNEYTRRPYLNFLFSLRPQFQASPQHKLTVGLRMDMDVNAVESADSSNTIPHQVHPGDLRIWLKWKQFAAVKKAKLSWSGSFQTFLPTSYLSQFAGKLLGLSLGISTTFKPHRLVTLSHSITLTKNFNRFKNATLDWSDFDQSRITRPGGAENVADGLTATGGGVVEWAIYNALSLTVTPIKKLSIGLSFGIANAFTYDTSDEGQHSSPYADPGRGQRDLMYGSFDVSYDLHKHFSVALGTSVTQSPKTLDNKSFRFPFWDTTNGAANRQVFTLTLTGSL
jgi:hypothetical protein